MVSRLKAGKENDTIIPKDIIKPHSDGNRLVPWTKVIPTLFPEAILVKILFCNKHWVFVLTISCSNFLSYYEKGTTFSR